MGREGHYRGTSGLYRAADCGCENPDEGGYRTVRNLHIPLDESIPAGPRLPVVRDKSESKSQTAWKHSKRPPLRPATGAIIVNHVFPIFDGCSSYGAACAFGFRAGPQCSNRAGSATVRHGAASEWSRRVADGRIRV